MGADWEPAPPVSSGWPVSFQVGTVGAGIGIGCGVGIGFGGPLALGSLPIIGQAAQGISAGLGGLLPVLGGRAAQSAVQGLGVQGLQAGFGCGVGVGYGFGAGLMLKPSATEQIIRTGQQVAGQLTRTVSNKLQMLGMTQQHFPQQEGACTGFAQGCGPTGSRSAVGTCHGSGIIDTEVAAANKPTSQHTAQYPWGDINGMVGGSTYNKISSMNTPHTLQQHTTLPEHQHQQLPVSNSGGNIEGGSSSPQQTQQQVDSIVAHTLLRQQQEIAQLKKQNKQLRQAVCRLDPRAPFCTAACGRSSRRGSRERQDQRDSSDWAS